ncbi:MAG TPA: CAP domain-containing protein [Pyrinomonadaceae bacterium]|nr:CAP domain-containing protein [Pyrinomonadaceae bacterium]
MTRYNLFPCLGLRARRDARFALSAVACLFISGLFAASAEAQTGGMRPVARLIGVSKERTGVPVSDSCETQARVLNASLSNARPRMAHVSASGDERRAFDLINAARRSRGESPLVWDAELTRMARQHSENMALQNFFDHVDRQGQNVATRARTGGVCGWSAIGENIAYNSGYDDPAGFAVERWLTSAKHRENLMRRGFTHSGIGVARSADGRVFFTQVFITR